MQQTSALLQQLEFAVSQGSPQSCHAALSYATDLLIAGRYSDEETWMFGEILGLLASEIEAAARAELAQTLARTPKAPANIIEKLAFDDAIDVAGPVLRDCEQLSVERLVQNARSKSQAHLLAISQRRTLHEDVTDVLVARGDQEVARSVARNSGARFSQSGFWHLVRRSENDAILAMEVGARRDIPRNHFQKLIARASEEVRRRLVALVPEASADIQDVVIDVTGAIQARLGPASRDYFTAKRLVFAKHRAGELTEKMIGDFAAARKFEELIVALSLRCELPVDVVERALLDEQAEMPLIVAKAAKLSWTTTRSILLLCAGQGGMAAHDLDKALQDYSVLSTTTARRVMGYYQSRQERSG
jgi:uncharacterized protein (DUF2336 family)